MKRTPATETCFCALLVVGCAHEPGHVPPANGVPPAAGSSVGPTAPTFSAQRLSARQSTSAPIAKDPQGKCLSERGCPFEPAAVPACAPATAAVTLERALALPTGSPVTVSGELVVSAMQTLMACDNACCNSAGGEVTLRSGNARAPLRDARSPQAFRCFGDDSRLCCGVSPVRDEARQPNGAGGATVLVHGLVQQDERGVTFIGQPELCSLDPQEL